MATATVPAALFASWFVSGTPTQDGVVKPADSVGFSNDVNLKNVDFYRWSEQMFLWLTSPAPGGGRIFSSPPFFDVSPPDASGNRTLIPHVNGTLRRFNLRAAKPGPHGLSVIFSKAGKMLEVEPPKLEGGKQLILNGEGKSVAIERVILEKGRQPVFLDKEGNKIVNVKPIIPPALHKSPVIQKFRMGKLHIFLDPSGNVIETEEGQAGDNGVLLTQSGSLVYYATIVNDVYAYFLTGTKTGQITPTPTQFPTTQPELDKIAAFAKGHMVTFPDPRALAIEIKTSWVETATLPNASSYITTMATVPTYDKTNPMHWVANGEKTVQLALLGMHVVGSANGHPEMIWATFEHFGNTPNSTYAYNATNGQTKTVNQDTSGTWLFCPRAATTGNFNMPRQTTQGADIVITSGSNQIGPSNTIRFKPWGGAADQSPNPLVTDMVASNTQIISMNNSVRGQLVGADIRKNYFFMGATWTKGGAAPAPLGPPDPATASQTSFPTGNAVGTSQLENSTMETFQPGSSSFEVSRNCLGCHLMTITPTDVSHVFSALQYPCQSIVDAIDELEATIEDLSASFGDIPRNDWPALRAQIHRLERQLNDQQAALAKCRTEEFPGF